MAAFSTADAISHWNELLAAEPDLDGAVEVWRAHFTERDLELDGRPLCTVLRPHFVTEERLAQQARVAALVLRAVRKVRAALTADRRSTSYTSATSTTGSAICCASNPGWPARGR